MKQTVDKPKATKPDWSKLLQDALEIPGRLSEAYRVFHNYSLGNRALAIVQMEERGMRLSPIASFKRWKDLGRSVKKGEKAIELCMPVQIRMKSSDDSTEAAETQDKPASATKTVFLLKRNWFSLDQTDGEDAELSLPTLPDWDTERAYQKLGITQVPFEHVDGNCQGYAKHGVMEIAINPLAALPMKTRFHEIAHHLLGHTKQPGAAGVMADGVHLPKCIKEAEAEATAYLCCATLGLPGMEESRGYIQSWLDGEAFPDKSARRVFSVADAILRAGVPESQDKGASHE